MIHRIITYYNTKSKIISTNNLKTIIILMSFPRRRESIVPQNFLDIVMLIGLGDKEHNYCKLSFPRRRESRYLLSQV
ncbi:hypothetical protein [Candidatus Tisiphia endosymbiont of Hybos culiciformis]|uniref:hypothetical protein n=1 Tax=Candidatus Tisiphia endosymbiont of Hybos culiciformis TaxID=3139331 RepID=UPI003CCABA7B